MKDLMRWYYKWFALLSLMLPFGTTAAASLIPSNDDYLPVEDAFVFSADRIDGHWFLRWQIAEGYYLYRERFVLTSYQGHLQTPSCPPGDSHFDKFFGRDMVTYHQFVEIEAPSEPWSDASVLAVRFQGCAEKGLCYNPVTLYLKADADGHGVVVDRSRLNLDNVKPTSKVLCPVSNESAATSSTTGKLSPKSSDNADNKPSASKNITVGSWSKDQHAIAEFLGDSNRLMALALFLLLGVGLTFTPCVFPMMPIIASIVAGQGEKPTPTRAFWLAFTYVQGMAVTYTALGIATAAVGHSISGVFQNDWVVALTGAIFVLLALSMFGFYELKMPAKWQQKLNTISHSQKGGEFAGVALMGAIAALIVSPCVTAPLSGALLYIADSGNYWFGGLAMYLLAIGMGIPLVLLAVSEGKWLPKAGAWMEGVRAALGVAMLAVGLYVVSPVLPGSVVLALWGTLLVTSGIFLGALDPRPEADIRKFWKAMGVVLLIAGATQLLGALMGGSNPLRPIPTLAANGRANHAKLPFKQVGTLEELRENIKQANARGQTVMLDLYADWCVACEELATLTLPDPRVRKVLSNTLWLQMDLSDASNPETVRVLKQFRVPGLPSVMFFDLNGEEKTRYRVTGYLPPNDFVARVEAAFGLRAIP